MFLNYFRNILRPKQMFHRVLATETLRATMFPQQCFLVCGGLKVSPKLQMTQAIYIVLGKEIRDLFIIINLMREGQFYEIR